MTQLSIQKELVDDRRRNLAAPAPRIRTAGPVGGPKARPDRGPTLAGVRPAGGGILHDHRGPHGRQCRPSDHRR